MRCPGCRAPCEPAAAAAAPIEDSSDAWRACDILGIPYYVWDFSERFKEDVVQDFIDEYAAGRTPNPCMRCNERIKFAALLEKAIALGFDAVCTGHYAKVITDADGNPELHRAADWAKDQSYVLGVLTHEQLKHSMFPLADTPSKAEVRAEAQRRGLSVANKPDSHDICFIPDGDTAGWLAEKIEMTTGRHRGRVRREGRRASRRQCLHRRPAPRPQARHPRRGRQAPLRAGDPARRKTRWWWARRRCWPSTKSAASRSPGRGCPSPKWPPARTSTATPRSAPTATPSPPAPGSAGDGLVVTLAEPLRGVAPGQTVVLYQGSRVLGQATIDAARSLQRAEL